MSNFRQQGTLHSSHDGVLYTDTEHAHKAPVLGTTYDHNAPCCAVVQYVQ